ncbi:uncharacterized protein K441DRAFT_654214 [Cenococcum geophilum 1.58]|uniref:uncharacterized protein n=1 Tax=Cenococcum geophilum 1.58 TaxID=794803 RepID=UPI00358E31E3|nr:hypothetical protein K441DRAFT_654214 [Cenococcum geophilum 1.58]
MMEKVPRLERNAPDAETPKCQPIKYVLFGFAKRTSLFEPIGRSTQNLPSFASTFLRMPVTLGLLGLISKNSL